ncbi:hypothetical protein [Cupriavidus necator]|uniref:hypothetical protein n=1 Tax=Cupriavidus necator TaxID=106590 RepID=UPI00278700D8|nr:hypothetical protein [Cupriavidus necator]MDQ0138536.1 hypothetical protein [Cupriavidus necator]
MNETLPATETTAEGLRSLIEHIEEAGTHGQLDPKFVRKLAKRIANEFQDMRATMPPGDSELAGLEERIEILLLAADRSCGARLTKSLQKLREHEVPFAGSEPDVTRHPQ